MRITLNLGKIDYNNSGRRDCMADMEVDWDGRQVTICANIWNPRHTDIYAGGQCVDMVAGFFPHHKAAQRLLAIWRDWHLNSTRASGSPAQRAWLKANPVTATYPESYYEKASAALAAAGLNPDPGYLHNGKPYSYGSAWLHEELPDGIKAELDGLFSGEEIGEAAL